jgi:hypothetical protein
MPTINFSVTQSIDVLAVNLSASEALVMNINNPLVGASYFGLETIPDSNGVYTSSSPKNTSGSFTLGTGIIGLVKDDYKMSAVVSPGDNVLTFSPAVAVTGSTLRTRGISSPPLSTGYDVDALAFFARVTTAGGTLSPTEMNATNQLIVDMKYYGLWDSMKAIYPMVGSSAAACAQNLVDSNFTGAFSSGWTFASTGVTPNGTSAYMNTGLIANSNLTLNNTHLSFYSRSNTSGNKVDIGTNDNAVTYLPLFKMYLRGPSNEYTAIQYSFLAGEVLVTTNTNSEGMYISSRISSTSFKSYKNNLNVNSTTTANSQTTISKYSLYIGASNNNGVALEFSDRQCAFASIGDGLTDTQASDLYTAVQAFQTTLNRQV